jgi:hypothetical protein
MEELPKRSPNEEPHGHEGERLEGGEIDLTGVIPQDDALRDVIGDAIVEAESGNGQFPEWGARTLARALANRLDNPFDGALHHYAITGHLNPDDMAHELAIIALRTDADDDETMEWINWLGTYALSAPTGSGPGENTTGNDDSTAPDLRHSSEAFGRHLRQVFAEADARGEPIAQADARSLAMLFSIFLDSDSEMARFADTGDANPVLLSQECQAVRYRTEHVPGADQWIIFEQHLAARSDLGRPPIRQKLANSEQHNIEPQAAAAQPEDIPVFGSPLEQVSAYLRNAFAEADARGGPITKDDAQSVATTLGALLGSSSEMSRFGQIGHGDMVKLQEECQRLLGPDGLSNQARQATDVETWVRRFERYLHASAEAAAETASPDVVQGISEHGDAFRAYLQLPDVDPHRDDLLQSFGEFYIGAYDSIDALVNDLTEDTFSEAEREPWAADGITPEETALASWDVVEIDGKLYVFAK